MIGRSKSAPPRIRAAPPVVVRGTVVDKRGVGVADATVVLVNVATGERVPCWAELDAWPDVDPAEPPLYVRAGVRFRRGGGGR